MKLLTPKDPATQEQVAFLVELGVSESYAKSLNMQQACDAIDFKLNSATEKQKAFLIRYGYDEIDVAYMTRKEATSAIKDIIAKARNEKGCL